ncbi:MAG: hypothetical protein JKY55_06035 [Aliivibrio sp.]|uniref:hypothetical protein n=1 Tax=Aliivibrio sp. TaxID=1872443 RepID=UPI001A5478CA|nr:hypothetical protein [Aliivibrio sp.]
MLDQTKIKRWVEVTFQREIIHQFEGADTNKLFATGEGDDVSFLANQHRHTVFFTVRVNVHHADREIEFFQLKRFCQSVFPGDTHDVGNASMEQLAERLLEALLQKYPKREWEIRVMEDNENGAIIRYAE